MSGHERTVNLIRKQATETQQKKTERKICAQTMANDDSKEVGNEQQIDGIIQTLSLNLY